MTPLHDAVQLTQEIIDFLLDAGADPDITDNNGRSAKDLAPSRFARPTLETSAAVIDSVPETEDLEAALPSSEVTGDDDTPVTEPSVEVPKTDAEPMEVDQQAAASGSAETSQPEKPSVEVTPEKAAEPEVPRSHKHLFKGLWPMIDLWSMLRGSCFPFNRFAKVYKGLSDACSRLE